MLRYWASKMCRPSSTPMNRARAGRNPLYATNTWSLIASCAYLQLCKALQARGHVVLAACRSESDELRQLTKPSAEGGLAPVEVISGGIPTQSEWTCSALSVLSRIVSTLRPLPHVVAAEGLQVEHDPRALIWSSMIHGCVGC